MSEDEDKLPTLPTLDLLEECDKRIWERYEAGQKKYGADSYLEVDTIQHAIDEILDLINYARFTYVKLRLFQKDLLKGVHADGSVATAVGPEMPGKQKPLSKNINGSSEFKPWESTNENGSDPS